MLVIESLILPPPELYLFSITTEKVEPLNVQLLNVVTAPPMLQSGGEGNDFFKQISIRKWRCNKMIYLKITLREGNLYNTFNRNICLRSKLESISSRLICIQWKGCN